MKLVKNLKSELKNSKSLNKAQDKLHRVAGGFFGDSTPVGRIGETSLPDDIEMLCQELPYRQYDEEWNLYINSDNMGFIIEFAPLTGMAEKSIEILAQFFNYSLPEGCMVQFMNLASPLTADAIDSWKNLKQGEIFQRMAERRAQYYNNHRWSSMFEEPFTIRDFRCYATISFDLTEKQKQTRETLDKLRDKLRSSLKSIGIASRELYPESLIGLCREILSPNKSANKKAPGVWNKLNDLNYQCVFDDEYDLKNNQIEINNKITVRSYSCKSYPKTWGQSMNLNLLGDEESGSLRISCPFITSFFFKVDKQEIFKKKAYLKSKVVRNKVKIGEGEDQLDLGDQAKNWQFVREQLQKNAKVVKTQHRIILFADPSKIEEEETTLQSIYNGQGWQLSKDNYIQFPSYLSILPFWFTQERWQQYICHGKTDTHLTSNCANLIPIQGEWKGSGESPCLMYLGKRGQIVRWNPFKTSEGNYNIAVAGQSGSGKSFLLQDVLSGILGIGGRGFVVDDGKSFKNSSKIQGGKFIEIKPGISINPFTMIDKGLLEHDSQYRQEFFGFLVTLLEQICRYKRGATEEELSLLKNAVLKAWDERTNETVTLWTVSEKLETQGNTRFESELAASLNLVLKSFLNDYGDYFKGKSSFNFDNPLIVFELSNIKGEAKQDLKSVVILILMHLVSETIYLGDRKTPSLLVIDEAWDMFKGKSMPGFIDGFVRRIRKYYGSLMVATQSITDFLKTDAAKAIYKNSSWKFLLNQNSSEVDEAVESGLIDKSIARPLKSIKTSLGEYSEILMYSSSGNISIVRLAVDKYCSAVYSSTPQDVTEIERLQKKGKSLADAIEILSRSK